ncbi:MAG TPA: FAD-binding oxidoreductase [Caulobacteraceae bacterium]
MSYDFIVVGAGIAGASVASELAASGKVLVIEREAQPGYHSTGRSAAMFIANYGAPEIAALARLSEGFLRAPTPGFAENPLLEDRGCMLLGLAGEAADLDRAHAESVANQRPTERISPEEAVAMVPSLRRDAVCGALWDPSSAAIDVNELHGGFLRKLRRLGAELATDCQALAFERIGGKWRATTSNGVFEAPVIVNAAGAWADTVGAMLGADRLGLTPHRRTALLAAPPDGVDIAGWPLVLHVGERFYFKPEAGKLLISPGDETPVDPCDVQPDDMDVAIGVDRVEQVTSLSIRRVTHRWAGLRTFAPDHSPVIGFDPLVAGLFWLAGQGGGGIQTSPAMAHVAATLARGLPLPTEYRDAGLTAAGLSPARLLAPESLGR